MTLPQQFDDSWIMAEKASFAHLIKGCGSIENKDAYLGYVPSVVNAWNMVNKPTTAVSDEAIQAPCAPSMCVPYTLTCNHLSRELCMRWVMRVVKCLPLLNDEESNVHILRVSSIGAITSADVNIANEPRSVTVWSISVEIEMVFSTNSKQDVV